MTGNHQVPADKEPVVQSSAPAAGVSSLPHLGSVSVGSWGEGTGVGARGRGQGAAVSLDGSARFLTWPRDWVIGVTKAGKDIT